QMEMPDIGEDVLKDLRTVMQQQEAGKAEAFRLIDKARKPILFWRHDEKPPEFPQSLAAARDKVEAAWLLEQARESKVLPLVRKIAEKLKDNRDDFSPPLLRSLSQEGRRDNLVLKGIAPLVPKITGDVLMGGHRNYVAYQLPKDTIPLAREDTVGSLLSL